MAGGTCPSSSPMKATSNGIFQGDNPLHFALPLVILQICLVLLLTRSLAFVLRPLRQPRVIAEILGGILLGPSVLGRSTKYLHAVFPPESLTLLDTLANLGLIFFLFLAGLELDSKTLRQTGKRVLCIASVGIALPFALGIGVSFLLRETISKGANNASFLIFMGVALSITAFPVLARVLAELKLLTTDIGKLAMPAAAVNDVAAWIFLALAVALSGSGKSPLISLWVFLSGTVFVICAFFTIPPLFKWISNRCQEGEPVEEIYVCATLAVVLAAGFVTDAIGIHAMFGGFVVGVLIPKEEPFASALVEKVEDLVSALFMPLYFVSSGLKTNVASIQGLQSWGLLAMVIFTACFGKIVGTVLVSLSFKIPLWESVALGLLMNTKGLVELIVLNIGKDRKVLNDEIFAIMVLMALFTTFMTTPLVMSVYKPARPNKKSDYKHKSIDRNNSDTQLRILACFHGERNIPSLINLLEALRGVGEPLYAYALHLMELSERTSAILMVHKARKNGLPFWNKNERGRVVLAFEAFRQLSQVIVRPMTAISSMSRMHEDICTTAERKRVALIILPFHKHMRFDGSLETTRTEFACLNRKVLEHAPCSVGILVDRGLGGTTHVMASHVSYFITVLFFGSRDDREALAYGTRMAKHPGIRLSVIHFITEPGEIVRVDVEEETQCTKSLIDEFKQKIAEDDSVTYMEKRVKDNSDIIAAVREINDCSLFLVGRAPDGGTSLASNWKVEYPELGPVGSLLASSEIGITASVLVIKQGDNNECP